MKFTMRDGFVENLPDDLPLGKTVLVVGPEAHPANNALVRLIKDLDPKGNWIRSIFKDVLTRNTLSQNVGLVLTMTNMKHGALGNVRIGARERQAFCSPRVMVTGDVKDVLAYYAEKRQEAINSNGHRGNVEPPQVTSLEVQVRSSVDEVENPASPEVGVTTPSISAETEEDELDRALTAIDNFSTSFNDVQEAVLVVAGGSKALVVQRDELKRQLVEKEDQIKDLLARLQASQEIHLENGKLRLSNKQLEAQVKELQTSLEHLRGLINTALQK